MIYLHEKVMIYLHAKVMIYRHAKIAGGIKWRDDFPETFSKDFEEKEHL